MSKFPVISAFMDKNTHVHYPVGAVYETDDQERSDFLQGEGFLGEQMPEPVEEPKAKGKKVKKSSSEE